MTVMPSLARNGSWLTQIYISWKRATAFSSYSSHRHLMYVMAMTLKTLSWILISLDRQRHFQHSTITRCWNDVVWSYIVLGECYFNYFLLHLLQNNARAIMFVCSELNKDVWIFIWRNMMHWMKSNINSVKSWLSLKIILQGMKIFTISAV